MGAENAPFIVAGLILFGLVAIELLSLTVGTHASGLVETWLPNTMADSLETGWVAWLHIGKVPVLVLLMVLLGGFSAAGLLIQQFARAVIQTPLPAIIASVPATLIAIYGVRVIGGVLARWMPKDETSAVSSASLVGRIGVIVTGTARRNLAAEVKVLDQHGNPLFVMVEPDADGDEFKRGERVLLVKQQTERAFRAIRNPNPHL